MKYYEAPYDRAWAEISLGALRHNYLAAKSAGKPLLCVIKANAYGHGAAECGRYLEKLGADYFGVACLSEALELRKAGIKKPILIMGHTQPQYAEILSINDLTQTLPDESSAAMLSAEAEKAGVTVKTHIKIDTGMSRLGICGNSAGACAAVIRITGMPNLIVEGMFSHFAAADDPDENDFTLMQLKIFTDTEKLLIEAGKRPKLCHIANSGAIMNGIVYGDLLRPGLMLYGLYPDNKPRSGGELLPVMSLKARISQTKELKAGSTVSYGRTYTVEEDISVAVVPCGYADGFSRGFSGKIYGVSNGKKCPQIGRICMDMHMLNITGTDITTGDEVTVLGAGGISLEEASHITGTLNYELACLICPRVPRVFKD